MKTRFGEFGFENGYPTRAAAAALREQLVLNRAVEVFLAQLPAVAVMAQRCGMQDFGARRSSQVIIWESLMDAAALLLTANTETVYGLGFLYLDQDGLSAAGSPPPMEFLNGSGQAIDTIHADTIEFFEHLHRIMQEEPAEVFTPAERFYLQAIGIEKGQPFPADPGRVALLAEAARTAAAFARANCFASADPATYYYPGKYWQAVSGVPYTFVRDGVLEIDLRAFVYYMGLGNSPAMMAKNVGAGLQYLWAYRDADGDFLDGAKTYRLRIPAGVPINNFWSVLVYDALSRSELQNDQPFPSVSMYGHPAANADGTIDVYFGPEMPPGQDRNWVQTVPGRGWFPIFRFYGPLEPFFDKTWQLPDVEKTR